MRKGFSAAGKRWTLFTCSHIGIYVWMQPESEMHGLRWLHASFSLSTSAFVFVSASISVCPDLWSAYFMWMHMFVHLWMSVALVFVSHSSFNLYAWCFHPNGIKMAASVQVLLPLNQADPRPAPWIVLHPWRTAASSQTTIFSLAVFFSFMPRPLLAVSDQRTDEGMTIDTTLLIHFFGKKGKAELTFDDFYRYVTLMMHWWWSFKPLDTPCLSHSNIKHAYIFSKLLLIFTQNALKFPILIFTFSKWS